MINLDFDAASFPAYDLLNFIYIYIYGTLVLVMIRSSFSPIPPSNT